MRRHPLTLAEEATFTRILSSYHRISVVDAIRLTKADLAERGIFSPSLRRTFERVARNWKTRNQTRVARND